MKHRRAHCWVKVGGRVWKLTLGPDGSLTVRQKHRRRAITLRADELVLKAQQLRDGSLCL